MTNQTKESHILNKMENAVCHTRADPYSRGPISPIDEADSNVAPRLSNPFLQSTVQAIEKLLDVGRPMKADVGRELGMSARTLQRRLEQRGTSFQRLILYVRMSRALRLLRDPSISIEEVAVATGYRNAVSFHKAFRDWTGTTPATYRLNPCDATELARMMNRLARWMS